MLKEKPADQTFEGPSPNKPIPIELVRRAHFSCGHRYFQPNWDDDKNKEVFGACYSPYGHGHNYILELFLTGPVNAESGMVLNLKKVDQVLKMVTDQLDHKHLNIDVSYFKNLVPTTENIALFCFSEAQSFLKDHSNQVQVSRVRLYETEDLWVEVRA